MSATADQARPSSSPSSPMVDAMMGDLMYHSYSAGFIILSYFVSVVGCWTALELLHRRTSTKGLYNWYLLLGAASSMGAVAIWAMHFIGNRAITMGDGEAPLQIAYSPQYTAGSFFLPICVVAIAFYLFTVTEQVSIAGVATGGLTAGIAVCGMHYLGQGGIANYQVLYDWRYILGSAIIAVVASTLALGVFFYFKSAWTNTWWKRMVCALLLAVAVSGMHWVATVGTTYRFRTISGSGGGLSRRATVIVVLGLAIGCCFALLVFAFVGQRSRQRYADRAQQVVLACATWDPDGRLMVTPDGLLPCRKITNTYVERSFNDVFSVEHPVFCWIFRATRAWSGVADLVPGMRTHLRLANLAGGVRQGPNDGRRDSTDGVVEDYSQAFKELFCVAAQDLATSIQEPLEKLGVLYEEIMSTGTIKKSTKAQVFVKANANNDLERAILPRSTIFGRGQLLFVVRKADKFETAYLQSVGYRFASVSNIANHLARSMQVTAQELLPRLEKMRNYPVEAQMLAPGVYLACFALRPVPQRGFDVLVRKDAKNLLPTYQMPLKEMSKWHRDFIARMNNWTVADCLDALSRPNSQMSAEERHFMREFSKGIAILRDQLQSTFFQDARLVARPLRAPCHNPSDGGSPGKAMVIAFRIMADVHQTRSLNRQFEFTPSKFFVCQQHVYPNSPDHAIFGRRVHREFALLNQRKGRPNNDSRVSMVSTKSFGRDLLAHMPQSPTLPKWTLGFPHQRTASPEELKNDNCSERSLVEGKQVVSSNPFGGIHVSNEISIDVSEVHNGEMSPGIEMSKLGVHSEAAVAPVERESFVDELLAMTINERRK